MSQDDNRQLINIVIGDFLRIRIRQERIMADGVGFEPTRSVNLCRFSRPVPSTTRSPIHYRSQVTYLSGSGTGSPIRQAVPLLLCLRPVRARRSHDRRRPPRAEAKFSILVLAGRTLSEIQTFASGPGLRLSDSLNSRPHCNASPDVNADTNFGSFGTSRVVDSREG